MPWGAAAAAAAGIYGANQQASAAKSAAGAQQDAANLSYQDQLALMRQQRRDAAPYRDSGYNALNQLNYLMGLGSPTALAHTQENFDPEAYTNWRIQQMTDNVMKTFKNPTKQAAVIAKRTERIKAALENPANAWADYNTRAKAAPNKTSGEFWKTREGGEGQAQQGEDYGFLQKRFSNAEFEKDPGYQFRMDEGNKAVESGAAARNGLLSGAAMKAMQKYSQGFASNEYSNAYNRFTGDQQNMYNRLAQMAGTGQQQINQTAQMNQNSMNQMGGYMQDAAAARASGIMGASNARQSGYQQLGNTLMDTWANYNSGRKYQGKPTGSDTGSPWSGQGSDGMQYV